MGAASAIASGIGAATSAGQAINSGIKGSKASQALNQQQSAADALYGQMLGQGQDLLGQLTGAYNGFTNPELLNQLLGMGQGAATGVADNSRATADALGNQGLANQAAGMLGGGYQSNVGGVPQAGNLMQFLAPALNQFDFGQVGQLSAQALQNALTQGDRARTSAREQIGVQTVGMQNGLDAALASRGISRNSGAAAAALQQHALGAQQLLGGLERDIANQAGNAALQAGQFDAQNALALGQMGSQYNLGLNQLGQQSALGAFQANLGAQQQRFGQQLGGAQLQAGIDQSANQYRLGAAGQLAGLQGMQNDVTLAQGQLRNAALTDPLQILQGIYQQNYQSPQMQLLGQLGQLAGGLFSGGIAGMESGLTRRAEGSKVAGSGKGAATGTAVGYGNDFATALAGKNAGTPPTTFPSAGPHFGVGR